MKNKRLLFFPMVALIAAVLVMILWNYVVVTVAGVPPIHFFQAAGMLLLCRILFGRFPSGGCRRRPYFGPPVRSHWINMSEAERKAFKDALKKRFE